MPKVLNKHKDKIPPNAVYVGRPSQWGNPFVRGKDGDRFCAPQPCHADVLLAIANSPQ